MSEHVVMSSASFVTILITTMLFAIVAGIVVAFLGQRIYRAGKSRVIWLNGDSGAASIDYVKAPNGEFVKGKGDDARRYILSGEARYTGVPATWIIDPVTGWNMRAPRRAETIDGDARLMKLAISTPQAYHLAIARNRIKDALNANTKDDKMAWVLPVAVVGLVAILAVLGVVSFLAFKVTGGGGPPGV